ncbi:hypothetical protein B0H19DRAFT_592089 [Mycena capillaripes]|nr:hypothetical protein B0H19DRAFT_592089 [Mycena capillaripes]
MHALVLNLVACAQTQDSRSDGSNPAHRRFRLTPCWLHVGPEPLAPQRTVWVGTWIYSTLCSYSPHPPPTETEILSLNAYQFAGQAKATLLTV